MKIETKTKLWKLIRVREKTWRKLLEIKRKLSRREDRDVSFDQVITNTIEAKRK